MSDDLYWFKWIPGEHLSRKVALCSIAGQGMFAKVCSIWWRDKKPVQRKELLKHFRSQKRQATAALDELVEDGIIDAIGDGYNVKFLQEQYLELTERHQKFVDAGRKGGLSRKGGLTQAEGSLKGGYSDATETLKHIDIDIDTEYRADVDVDTRVPPATPASGWSNEWGKILRLCRNNQDELGWRHLYIWCVKQHPKLFDMAIAKAIEATKPNKPYLSEVDEWARKINQANQGETE